MTDEAIPPKRRYPRISLPKGMRVAWHGGDLQLFSRVQTLGMGGLFISVPDPPSVGTKLRLSFEVPGGNVHAEAIVRNIVRGEGMGVEFTKLGWQPQALPTELKYRDSLIAHLREQLREAKIEPEYRHLGTTTDIYVKQPGFFGSSEVFVELKRRPPSENAV